MTFLEIMSVVSGVVGALIALAALKTEQRVWLKKLSGKLALIAFAFVAVANSVFGIYLFIAKTAPSTR